MQGWVFGYIRNLIAYEIIKNDKITSSMGIFSRLVKPANEGIRFTILLHYITTKGTQMPPVPAYDFLLGGEVQIWVYVKLRWFKVV